MESGDLRFCLDKANEMSEYYRLYVLDGGNVQKSMDDTLWLCREYLEKKIHTRILRRRVGNFSLRGCYLANRDGSYTIVLNKDENFCWSRFVLCKELFHVVLDQEKYWSMDIYEHVENIHARLPAGGTPPGLAQISEGMAEFSAMEYMFPYTARRKELANTTDCLPNYLAIAHRYKIPRYYVEKFLSDPYMELLGKHHDR